MSNQISQDDAVKMHLLSTYNLIKDLSRNLNLDQYKIDFAEEQFENKAEDMNIKDLALLNEMLIGTCLKQIA
ncbi:hypothetical protein F949_01627 [Acinetobacter junii NIPH 182]|uniref:hypothetical protein n=1 Tax=Acinetobacter junii TaxID=40215 RepID=UPI0002CFC78A|nr:hypothetical protein [Acinetobacter junii]ENV64238.1 hypothetical protein F949_01627 [Acinetobacter junii NIPH 182]